MNVTSIINISKFRCKKNLTLKNIPAGRFDSSLRFPGVKGTEQQRSKLACELNDKLFKLIHDIFNQKIKMNKRPTVNKVEIKQCIKEVVPTAKIDVIYDKCQDSAGYVGTMEETATKKIAGFVLGLRGSIKQRDADGVMTLRHEMKHFFDYITQPKSIARDNTTYLIGKLENFTEKKNDKHLTFYDNVLYHPKKYKNDEKEMNYLKGRLGKYFDKNPTPPAEKIEILQNWRGGLKAERDAYADEQVCISSDKEIVEAAVKEAKEYFFFEPKIKLVEQMLKEEISAVRKQHAKNYGKN
jgi:hypothetical protein